MLEYKADGEYIDKVNNNFILGKFKLINSVVQIAGKNNFVVLDNVVVKNSIIYMRNNNCVFIAENTNIDNIKPILLSENVCCYIGKNFTSGKTFIRVGDANLYIGSDVMFASDIYIQNHDGHGIYNIASKALISRGQSIIIGEHVWCGYNATLLKGAVIGSGSIIGAKALVNSEFGSNTIVAGVPAREIKQDIFWIRQGVQTLDQSKLQNYLYYKEDASPFIFKEDTFIKKIKQIDQAVSRIITSKEKAEFLLKQFNLDINLE